MPRVLEALGQPNLQKSKVAFPRWTSCVFYFILFFYFQWKWKQHPSLARHRLPGDARYAVVNKFLFSNCSSWPWVWPPPDTRSCSTSSRVHLSCCVRFARERNVRWVFEFPKQGQFRNHLKVRMKRIPFCGTINAHLNVNWPFRCRVWCLDKMEKRSLLVCILGSCEMSTRRELNYIVQNVIVTPPSPTPHEWSRGC